MKKSLYFIAIILICAKLTSAQIIPSFEFGAKAGVNMSSFSTKSTFNTDNRAGYLGGVYARIGGLGFNFQPELYVTSKNVDVSNNSTTTKVKFTSIDVPLLLGSKIGAFGFGGRFYTGPLFSFAVNNDQSFSNALGNAVTLNHKDQNMAWDFGVGVDVKKISVDLRYEAGITKQSYNNNTDKTRINLFNLSVSYRLFSL
jgi:hypothetical protein